MDDKVLAPKSSLKTYFKRWVLVVAISTSIFSVLIISLFSFFGAKDLQDETLVHFMNYADGPNINRPFQVGTPKGGCKEEETFLDELIELKINFQTVFSGEDSDFDGECKSYDDTRIIIEKLSESPSDFLSLTVSEKEGYGLVERQGSQWRILIGTKSDGRYVVAQKTEIRNEMVLNSVYSSLALLSLIGVVLFFAIDWVVTNTFLPVKVVSNKLDEQNPYSLQPLVMKTNLEEIQPFLDAINRLIEKVREKDQKEKLFISNASHELRTPITAINLQFENLENAKNEEERKKRVRSLKKGIEHVKNLLEQLLDLSKVQAIGVEGERLVSFNEMVEEIVGLLFPLAEKKNIDLGIKEIEIDKNYLVNQSLSQVLLNSISNAIKYTPEHGKVDVSVRADGANIEIIVDDSGPGLSDIEKEKVFDPFYTVPEYQNTGAGLGLSICGEISLRLGSKIEILDSPLGGLRFKLSKYE